MLKQLLGITTLLHIVYADKCPTGVPGSKASCTQGGTYKSFDGATLHFNGSSRYIVATPCQDMFDDKLDSQVYQYEWSVEVQNKIITLPNTRKSVVYAEYVLINAHNHIIHLREFGEVTIDKQEPILPVNIKDGKITLYRRGWKVFLNTDFGLIVSFDARGAGGQHLVEVQLDNPDFACRVCGICGNWNGNNYDDLIPRYGKQRVLDYAVVESWISDTVVGDMTL